MNKENYTLLCDFYELTMANGYFLEKMDNTITYFDVFFRDLPKGSGYAIACGLESIIDYINNLKFDDSDIEFLRSKNIFDEQFLEYLRNFKFTGDIYACEEGSIIFPHEPILTVRAPAIEAQFVETYLLLVLNHQSLIATKTSRIVYASDGRPVMEFGSRRAQGESAAILGARSAYIAGASGTACTISDKYYGSPALGTMAHSWVQMFNTEYEAFDAYCKHYPTNAVLLIDTYNVLNQGLPNAIKAFKANNITKGGVRIDSGDIAYLSKKCRKILDQNGLKDIKIVASNSLDENIISELLLQGACIDSFGVGERLITAKDDPVFGCVYKLSAVEKNGEIIPKIKVSENVAKITNPGFKKTYRIYDKETNKAMADIICLHDEEIDETKPLEIFDEHMIWKRKVITNYYIKPLLTLIFKDGKQVYKKPSIEEIRTNCQKQLDSLWDEVKRLVNPQTYYVDLSQKLYDLKYNMINKVIKG